MRQTLLLISLLACTPARGDEACIRVYGSARRNAFLAALRELDVAHDILPVDKLTGAHADCDAIMIVAGEYPRPLALPPAACAAIRQCLARGTSVYVEYARLPGWAAGKVEHVRYERIFVPKAAAAKVALPALTILEEHESRRLALTPPSRAEVWLAYGRVAGFDTAVFGPAKLLSPALMHRRHGKASMIYAATALSNAARGRYKPRRAWHRLLRQIVLHLLPEAKRARVAQRFIGLRAWTEPRDWLDSRGACRLIIEAGDGAAVRADCQTAGHVELHASGSGGWSSGELKLGPGTHVLNVLASRGQTRETSQVTLEVGPRAERYHETLRRNLEWFGRAGMLVAEDGSRGVYEGLRSPIRPDGTQAKAGCVRVDCVSECALMFFLYGRLARSERWQQVGRRMMDYVATKFQVTSKDTYYFGDWQSRGEYHPERTTYVFNDDSGAATVMCFLFHHFTGDEKYLEPALRGAKYFQRIASKETGLFGRMGHCGWRGSSLTGVPWDKLQRRRVAAANPHQMSWPQAAMLYAYAATGDRSYLDLAEQGIRFIMERYPKWHITTSRSCEHVRMLFPLALLYRYRPGPDVKKWLDAVIEFIRSKQAPCGAIQEWDGRSPTSNERFGTGETSIFQQNRDPVTDQLYNTGFALMHLWVAHKAAGDTRLLGMFERLGDYLTRIQVQAPDPMLNGTWLRAFDLRRWEYFGSSADVGWGPYCVETGWSCAPLDLGLIFYLADIDPAPAQAGGTAETAALSKRLDREFDDVRRLLSLPPPAKLTGLRVVSSRGNYVELAWDKPTDGAAVRYRVYGADRGQLARTAKCLLAATRGESCLLARLKPRAEYEFQVVAENAHGQTSAPSVVLSVCTGPVSLARGKRYVKSARPQGYSDVRERESTDGIYAGPYRDALSYGYRLPKVGAAIDLVITVDLESVQSVARASHHACGAAGYKPDRMAIETSVDGQAWQPRGEASHHRGEFLILDFPATRSRYVRFRFHKKRRRATDDWLFIDELEAF